MKILVARQPEEIESAFEKLSVAKEIGCDTETSGLSARTSRIFSVQFSDGDLNVLIPFSENVALGKLKEILANPNIVKIFHNAKFDLQFLRANSINVENVFCTMIAEKILTRGAGQSASLAETLYRYFAVDLEKSARSSFNKNWDGVWTRELIHYALSDVVYLPRLMREQTAWLGRLGLNEDFQRQMAKLFDDLKLKY